jgi:hypothetical protein
MSCSPDPNANTVQSVAPTIAPPPRQATFANVIDLSSFEGPQDGSDGTAAGLRARTARCTATIFCVRIRSAIEKKLRGFYSQGGCRQV